VLNCTSGMRWQAVPRPLALAAVAYALLRACTPDVRVATAAPADLAPVACDMGDDRRDLWGAVERFKFGRTYAPATVGVVVVGAEGSGSKLAALAVARAVEAARRSESEWVNTTCEGSAGVWAAWDGHGVHANYCTGTVVVHRSLPHGACFPPRRKRPASRTRPAKTSNLSISVDSADFWTSRLLSSNSFQRAVVEIMRVRTRRVGFVSGPGFPDVGRLVRDVASFGFATSLVLCARDGRSALRSKVRAHQRRAAVARDEHALATAALQRLLEDPPAPAYVFAYEAYAALGSAYLRPLLAFLKLPLVAGGDSLATRDGNADWQAPRRPADWLRDAAVAAVAGRPPAYRRAGGGEL